MRVLFTAVPAFGHVVPMRPLADAAARDGSTVAFATGAQLAGAVGEAEHLPVGPSAQELVAAATAHDGGVLAIGPGNRAGQVGLFTRTRVESTFDPVLRAARAFAPDVVVGDTFDYVAPLVASALGVPWVAHGISVEPPPDHVVAYDAGLAERFADHGLDAVARVARVDPWPAWLERGGVSSAADAIPVRPLTNSAPTSWRAPTFTGHEDRPVVLVTLGTIVEDADLLAAVAHQVVAAGANVVVTAGLALDPDDLDLPRERASAVGFVPIAALLEGAAAVVSVGGAGTVLAALSCGTPLVVVPVLADQPLVAERVAACGAGEVAGGPQEVGSALERVLTGSEHRRAARRAAERIASMPSPDQAWAALVARLPA